MRTKVTNELKCDVNSGCNHASRELLSIKAVLRRVLLHRNRKFNLHPPCRTKNLLHLDASTLERGGEFQGVRLLGLHGK